MNHYRRVRMKLDEFALQEVYGFTPCGDDGNPRRAFLTDSSAKARLFIVGMVKDGMSVVIPYGWPKPVGYYEVQRGCVGERFSAVDDADAWRQVKDLWFADL